MKTLLITGASSGLGKEVLDYLKKNSVYRIQTIGRSLLNDVVCDLSTVTELSAQIDFQPDSILHFAACVPDNIVIMDTARNAAITRKIDRVVLKFAQSINARVFYFSGCSLYAENKETPIREHDPLSPSFTSAYLNAKKEGEKLFQRHHDIILRISSPLTSNFNAGNIVSIFKNQLDTCGKITVWGDGGRLQNFIDARSISYAVHGLLEANNVEGIYNVASHTPTTIKELAKTYTRILGGEIIYTQANDQSPRKPMRFSIEKIKKAINWMPTYSLEESLQYFLQKAQHEHEGCTALR